MNVEKIFPRPAAVIADSPAGTDERPPIDWRAVSQAALKPAILVPALLALVGFGLAFSSLWPVLPDIWTSADGYYSHGPLIPLISAYIVYRRWPDLVKIPVKGSWVPLVFLVPLLVLLRAANSAGIALVLSFGFLAVLLLGIWFSAGFRWMKALAAPVMYMAFALPIWTMAIDTYTNPLQLMSTKVAAQLLKVLGLNPYQPDATTIYLSKYTLDVGVPCSGLKLALALIAFAIFFMLIARLKWMSNVALAVFLLPLCLFINGLRITLIGIVGNSFGEDAGHQFHDYSGYITLVVCFLILFRVAKLLGWKN